MAISITTKQPESFGSQSGAVGKFTLDSSYPTGGYSVTPGMFSLSLINSLSATTTSGYDLAYNYTTQKLMVFTAAGGAGGTTGSTSGGTPAGSIGAPALAMNSYTPAGSVGTSSITETPAVAVGAGTLAFVPVNVTSVYATAAGTPQHLIVVPSTVTPATGEIAINFGTGAFTTFAGDAVTAITVVYQNSGGTFTGTPAVLTGTVAAPVFVGSALAGHTHTVAAGGGGFSEVSNGTNLSTVVANYIVIGQ